MSLLLRSARMRDAILRSFFIVVLAYWSAQKLALWLAVESAPVVEASLAPKLVQVSLDWQPSCGAPVTLMNPSCPRPAKPAKASTDDLEASIPLTFRK